MKLRGKIIIAELSFSIILLVALLLSAAPLRNYLDFINFQIKFATLKKDAETTRSIISNITYENFPTVFLVTSYELSDNKLNEAFDSIKEDRFFRLLPEEVKQLYDTLLTDYHKSSGFLRDGKLEEYLNLRSQYAENEEISLQTLAARTLNSAKPVQATLETLLQYEQKFNSYNLAFEQIIVQVDGFGNNLLHNNLIVAIGIPAGIMLLALAGIIFFGEWMGRNIRILDNSLQRITRGDFSLRVTIEGNDEFASLAGNINTFTQTLETKLETFRSIMMEVGNTLTTSINSAQIEETLTELAIHNTRADGAAIYNVIEEGGGLIMTVMSGQFRPPFAITDLPEDPAPEDIQAIVRSRIIQPGQTVIGQAALSGKPLIIRDLVSDPSQEWLEPADSALFLSSVMVLPLQTGSTVFGAMVLTSSRPDMLFSELEFVNMKSFAELAAITLDNINKYADLLEASQINRELSIAEEIQQDLLPSQLPRIACGQMAYLSRSIKGLNGDYFDVYPLKGDKTLVTVCEVAGRGVPAGLIMVMLRTVLRLLASECEDALTFLTRLNRSMTHRIAVENYAGVSILVFDNSGYYSFASAASYPMQILHENAESFEAIMAEGIPVGVDADAVYTQAAGQFQPGDIVLLHSDGIPESRNREGKTFTLNTMLDLIRTQTDKTPQAIVDALRTELEYFERGTIQKDDQTSVVLNFTGRTSR